MQPSPYTPGGLASEVPGRGEQLGEIDERLAYLTDVRALVGRIRVDHGVRGVGKTSMLRVAQAMAERRGALTVWVTAGDGIDLITAIEAEIARRTLDWKRVDRQRLAGLLRDLTVTVSAGVPGVAQVEATHHPRKQAVAGARDFEAVVREAAAGALRHRHTGLVIFVDEIQQADPAGLRVLAQTWQHLQAEGPEVPAALFAAGLPDSVVAINRAVTFSERFAYRPLGPLSAEAAATALAGPARNCGVSWQIEAIAAAVAYAAGYPYTVQLIGDAAWTAAGRPDPGGVITIDHVAAAIEAIQIDLNALFRSRWERATPAEQRFLRAMADLDQGGSIARSAIAQRLGTPAGKLGTVRGSLLHKGFIEVDGHGLVRFSTPGFGAYVRRLE